MPSKLTGMLSSGRPVIATADAGTQVACIVAGNSPAEACGLVAPPEDSAALSAAARSLISDKELRVRLGTNARRYAVEHLGRQQVLEQFERDLQSLFHVTNSTYLVQGV
jgi:colanic acid biosynthesis glycosyl transferase WcaI